MKLTASFAIVDRKTGRAIAETWSRPKAEYIKAELGYRYEVLPIADWLARYNRLVKEAGGREPSTESLKGAMS